MKPPGFLPCPVCNRRVSQHSMIFHEPTCRKRNSIDGQCFVSEDSATSDLLQSNTEEPRMKSLMEKESDEAKSNNDLLNKNRSEISQDKCLRSPKITKKPTEVKPKKTKLKLLPIQKSSATIEKTQDPSLRENTELPQNRNGEPIVGEEITRRNYISGSSGTFILSSPSLDVQYLPVIPSKKSHESPHSNKSTFEDSMTRVQNNEQSVIPLIIPSHNVLENVKRVKEMSISDKPNDSQQEQKKTERTKKDLNTSEAHILRRSLSQIYGNALNNKKSISNYFRGKSQYNVMHSHLETSQRNNLVTPANPSDRYRLKVCSTCGKRFADRGMIVHKPRCLERQKLKSDLELLENTEKSLLERDKKDLELNRLVLKLNKQRKPECVPCDVFTSSRHPKKPNKSLYRPFKTPVTNRSNLNKVKNPQDGGGKNNPSNIHSNKIKSSAKTETLITEQKQK